MTTTKLRIISSFDVIGGNLAYFAVARIAEVEQDINNPSMSYARYADYVQFDNPVP